MEGQLHKLRNRLWWHYGILLFLYFFYFAGGPHDDAETGEMVVDTIMGAMALDHFGYWFNELTFHSWQDALYYYFLTVLPLLPVVVGGHFVIKEYSAEEERLRAIFEPPRTKQTKRPSKSNETQDDELPKSSSMADRITKLHAILSSIPRENQNAEADGNNLPEKQGDAIPDDTSRSMPKRTRAELLAWIWPVLIILAVLVSVLLTVLGE